MQIVVPEEFRFLYVTDKDHPVVKIPANVLRQKGQEVGKISKKTLALIDEMTRVLKMANGIGLAAPQLGVLQRIVVIAPEGMRPTPLINPRVLKTEGTQTGQEGCLSIPGLYGDVTRPVYVEIEAQDRRGNLRRFQLEELGARVALHEIDHLDGVLFIDKVDPKTLHWVDPNQPHPDEE
jgi:peptide deformylase